MNSLPLLDWIETARGRRDEGMAVAESRAPDWFGLALVQIGQLRNQRVISDTFTFEDVVEALTPMIGPPPSKYVPGALCMRAAKLGLLEKTGAYRQAKGKAKNAHASPVYRWSCA